MTTCGLPRARCSACRARSPRVPARTYQPFVAPALSLQTGRSTRQGLDHEVDEQASAVRHATIRVEDPKARKLAVRVPALVVGEDLNQAAAPDVLQNQILSKPHDPHRLPRELEKHRVVVRLDASANWLGHEVGAAPKEP